jgi:hypothetical protein
LQPFLQFHSILSLYDCSFEPSLPSRGSVAADIRLPAPLSKFLFINPSSLLTKSFIYESVRYSSVRRGTIEVAVLARQGSQARGSGCDRTCPTYDHAPQPRVWLMPPLFRFALALIYAMRRVQCPPCGVVVEKVPWATGKHGLCDGFRLLLARWARKLSWDFFMRF